MIKTKALAALFLLIAGGAMAETIEKIHKTEAEWKKILTPEQYHIMREKGTERPGSGSCLLIKDKGIYSCAACGLELFRSHKKFESGTGWPSFVEPISK